MIESAAREKALRLLGFVNRHVRSDDDLTRSVAQGPREGRKPRSLHICRDDADFLRALRISQ